MKQFLFILTIFIGACSSPEDFKLQSGDILFQDLDCGVYCESIESVTLGYKGANLSHCGIVVLKDGSPFVLEAISKGVSQTPLDSFLIRSKDKNGNPKVLVGRLKEDFNEIIPEAVNTAQNSIGLGYDEVYDLKNDKMYCSELIYYSYRKESKFLFDLKPMTFKAANSDSTFSDWRVYFEDLKVPIPEGELGLNPGSISLSKNIDIVYQYGFPDGMQ